MSPARASVAPTARSCSIEPIAPSSILILAMRWVRLPDGRAVGVTARLDDVHHSAVGYTLAEGHGFKNNCRLDYREDEASSSGSEVHGRVRVAAPTASPAFSDKRVGHEQHSRFAKPSGHGPPIHHDTRHRHHYGSLDSQTKCNTSLRCCHGNSLQPDHH